jgi:hypothetical protein
MLNTYIDGLLLNDFFSSKPAEIPAGAVEDYEDWLSLFVFLKSKTNLLLYNIDSLNSSNEIFLTALTTGRQDSEISIENDFECDKHVESHCEKLKFDLFFSPNLKKYATELLDKNNIFYANIDDYWDKWNSLNYSRIPKSLDVRKSAEELVFKSWNNLNKYLQKSNSIILFDRYILSDNSLIPSNLFKIIDEFEEINNDAYSFVIITQSDKRNPNNNKRGYSQVDDYIKEKKYKCKLACVFASHFGGGFEHDRTIITNYFRVDSGDSFNYFLSKGDIITKTSISFSSHTECSVFQNSNNRIKDFKVMIEDTKKRFPNNIFGDIKNRILD